MVTWREPDPADTGCAVPDSVPLAVGIVDVSIVAVALFQVADA
jgi:hypothetical protein